MTRLVAVIVCLYTLLYPAPASTQARVTLGADSSVVFASRQAASEILTADDAYTSRMSQFDRMLRLKSTSRVTQAEYFQHLADNALDWTGVERDRLKPLLRRLSNALSGYRLPLPPTVLLIKTTGKEEIGEGHTRANAIVLPLHSLAEDDKTLYFLLAHELFHVMSRYDERFRRAAYAIVGFRLGPEVRLPPVIAALQITNPDAPRHDSYIDVRNDGQTVTVVPVLLSRSAVFDPEIGDRLSRYWALRLMVIEKTSAQGRPTPRMRNGAPVLLRVKQVDGFFDQVGRNTRYIIHPEEILAENFAFLVTGKPVAEPQRVEALRRVLSGNDGLDTLPAH